MLDDNPTSQRDVLHLSTVLVDPFDGAIRILGDAQRFGLDLIELHLEPLPDRTCGMRISLRVPAGSDADLLRSRFARHGAVASVERSRKAG